MKNLIFVACFVILFSSFSLAFSTVPAKAVDLSIPWAIWDMETALPNVDISKFTVTSRCLYLNANQGVAYDGTYFYTGSLDKLGPACNLISHRDVLPDVPGASQINSLYYNPDNGHLFAGANNYPSVPRYGWIWEGYASNFTKIAVHPVEAYWSEGTCYFGGFYWVIYDYSQTISQFTTSWAFVADYSLDFWGALAGSIFGYQGCRWHGNYLYLTIHENGFPDDLYMHVYLWTGTGFYQYQKIRSPSPNSTQGFDFYGSRAFFSERIGSGSTTDYIANVSITFGGTSPDMYIDKSGFGHSLWSHNTTLTGGKPGLGQFFAGINSSSRYEQNSYMEVSGIPLDASGWGQISFSATERTSYSYGQIIAAKHLTSTNGEWFVKIDDATHWRFVIINSLSVRVDSVCTVGISDGEWHQVLATYDGAKMKMYTDGTLCQTTNQTGTIKTTQWPLEIGGFYGDRTTFNFRGTIDNVTIWKNFVVNATTIGQSSIPPAEPAFNPFSAVLNLLAPSLGGTGIAGFLLSVILIVLLIVILSVFVPKLMDGLGILIPIGLGLVLTYLVGWFPLWGLIFIAILVVFVLVDPLDMQSKHHGAS